MCRRFAKQGRGARRPALQGQHPGCHLFWMSLERQPRGAVVAQAEVAACTVVGRCGKS